MKNNKGFTLIEVILSITLMGIISVGLLGAMTNNYLLLSHTKSLTENAFSAQEKVEADIEAIKVLLNDEDASTNPTVVTVDYTLFERDNADHITVSCYKVDSGDSIGIMTLVAEMASPEFVVPVVTATNLKLNNGTTDLTNNYAYRSLPNLNAKTTTTMTTNGVFLVNKHEWYVSRSGFNIPIVGAANMDVDYDYGRLYPLFPNDYMPVPIKSETNSSTLSALTDIRAEYAGRHIIYTVTPFAISGKQGATVFSQPVFLAGLPVIDSSLILHLDASLISKEDTDSVATSGSDFYVKKWKDQSGSGNDLVQTTVANRPKLSEVQYQDDVYSWGKRTEANSSATTMSNTSFDTDTATFSFVMVAKTNAVTPTEDFMIRGGGAADANKWSLGWLADGNLGFSINGTPATRAVGTAHDDAWHVYTGIAANNILRLRIDKVEQVPGIYAGSARMNAVSLKWNNASDEIDIAEVLVYKKDISASGDDLDDIETYLLDKYDPDPATSEMYILNLIPIPTQTVYKNTAVALPNTVMANMSNGTVKQVAVSWSNLIDTTTSGVKTSTGTATVGTTKTLIAIVNVVEIDSLKPLEPIVVGDSIAYPLPASIPAIMRSGTTITDELVNVTWSPSTTAGLGVGAHVLTAAAVLDSSKTIDLAVEVVAIEHNIAYMANGAVGTMAVTGGLSGASVIISDNAFTRDSYVFAGWNSASDGSGTGYTSGQIITMPSGGTTLYAMWTAQSQTITYNGNGATSGTMSNTTGLTDQPVTLRSNTFTKTSCRFAGWSTSPTGPVIYTNGQQVTMPAGGMTLYAKWTARISFNSNGGSGTMVSMEELIGTSIALRLNTFTKGSDTFVGWGETSGTSAVVYEDQETITMPNGDKTLYAQWRTTRTISYNANGGSGSMVSSYGLTGESVTLKLNTFTRSGYTFAGWATTAGGTVVYTNGQSLTVPASNLTLYAKWTYTAQTIVYDANGGRGTMADTIGNTGETVTLSANSFTKWRSTFDGWATTPSGPVIYSNRQSITMPAGGLTLYAKWR